LSVNQMITVLPFPPRAVLDPRANRDDAVRCIVARLLSEVDAREEKEFGGYAVGAVSAHDISLKAAAHLSGLYFWIWSARTDLLEGFIRAGGIGHYRGGSLHIEKWIRGNWEKQVLCGSGQTTSCLRTLAKRFAMKTNKPVSALDSKYHVGQTILETLLHMRSSAIASSDTHQSRFRKPVCTEKQIGNIGGEVRREPAVK
jgi:hypothetical protein